MRSRSDRNIRPYVWSYTIVSSQVYSRYNHQT
nr:MAG TPA: bacteriocin [Caudoviricetes sp.]